METQQYKTKDLAEAACLITTKKRLVQVDRNSSICWFVFDDQKACEALSREFFFGEVLVNARDFYEALNRLKHKIFS